MLQSNVFDIAKLMDDTEALVPDGVISSPRRPSDIALRKAAVLGNYPPRQCGLATFTRDIYTCLARALPQARLSVIAMNDPMDAPNAYPPEVTHQLPQDDRPAYAALAHDLNRDGTQVLFVQHEFGIYGGPSGAWLLDLLERVDMPVVTTLHTVLERPTAEQRLVMQGLIRLSSTLVTMAQKGADILRRVYGVPESQIAIVPHGAPARPLRETDSFKTRLNLQDHKTLMTFGLLSPNKGIETVIRALPAIVEACPSVMYLIAGATHPHLIRNEGEIYRDGLKTLAQTLGVESHIRFIDRFIGDNDLIDLLQATDVYVTPYLTEAQVTSGTLSYALALGRPVVSTPYWHAAEALEGGVGIICPFNDAKAFAGAISDLLACDRARTGMSERAYRYGLGSRWSTVASAYVDRARQDVLDHDERPAEPVFAIGKRPSWSAITRMSDDCGIFQHGKYGLPDRRHGYCTDDNGRALSLAARQSRLAPLEMRPLRHAYRWAAFVNHAWNAENGRFRNFMSYGRQWLDDGGSDDCCARTFEALVDVARSDLPEDLRAWAVELGQRVAPVAAHWTSTRAQAVMIKALLSATGVVGDDRESQVGMARRAHDLHRLFTSHARDDFPWLEPRLSYDNARLSEGLILAGASLEDAAMRDDGLRSLHWLMQRQTVRGHFAPIATSHFDEATGDHPLFDQQPIEVLASIDACLSAWRVTSDRIWKQEALRAYGWFDGRNIHGLRLTTDDGGSYDGLTPEGLNHNQGAESILAYPLSWTSLKSSLERPTV